MTRDEVLDALRPHLAYLAWYEAEEAELIGETGGLIRLAFAEPRS